MPVEPGRRPVRTLDRDGLHSGAWQWALVNSVPRAARRSMFGVFACGWPPRQPTQSFRSSMAMNRTLGRAGRGACAPGLRRRRPARPWCDSHHSRARTAGPRPRRPGGRVCGSSFAPPFECPRPYQPCHSRPAQGAGPRTVVRPAAQRNVLAVSMRQDRRPKRRRGFLSGPTKRPAPTGVGSRKAAAAGSPGRAVPQSNPRVTRNRVCTSLRRGGASKETTSWRTQWPTSSFSGSRTGASAASTATPATASTASRPPCARPTTSPASSRPATKKWPRSWPARTPSSPARSASAWPPAAPARSTCSTGCTTPRWTTSRSSPSSGRPPPPPSAAHYQQEVDLQNPVQGRGQRVLSDRSPAPPPCGTAIDRAIRIALDQRTRHLRHPSQGHPGGWTPSPEPPHAHDYVHSRHRLPGAAHHPQASRTCEAAAEMLNEGKKVAMLVGAGGAGRDRRGDADGRTARRRRRQELAGQGRHPRRRARTAPAASACSAPSPATT